MFVLLFINVVLLTLAPQYVTYGNQRYSVVEVRTRAPALQQRAMAGGMPRTAGVQANGTKCIHQPFPASKTARCDSNVRACFRFPCKAWQAVMGRMRCCRHLASCTWRRHRLEPSNSPTVRGLALRPTAVGTKRQPHAVFCSDLR